MDVTTTTWTNPPTDVTELVTWLGDMRGRDPVCQDQSQPGWHVFGYPEAQTVLSNHTGFSSDFSAALPPDSPLVTFACGNLGWMDPPRHRRLRSLVSKVFTPHYVTELEPLVASTTTTQLEPLTQDDAFDFVGDVIFPITVSIIAGMLGIPASDHAQFRRWSGALLAPETAAPSTQDASAVTTIVDTLREMDAYLRNHIRSRRGHHRPDLTTALLGAEVDGTKLSEDEIAGLIALLLTTGQGATQTLANAMICFDQHPQAWHDLRVQPEAAPSAIEEVMRYRTQVTRVARFTAQDVTVAGKTIPAGQVVSIWLAAANRDPRAFADPDTFDIRRNPNPHLAMSHGIHFCLGSALARLETRIALTRILAAISGYSIDYASSALLDPRIMLGANRLVMTVRPNGHAIDLHDNTKTETAP